jgi:hypothetical protein
MLAHKGRAQRWSVAQAGWNVGQLMLAFRFNLYWNPEIGDMSAFAEFLSSKAGIIVCLFHFAKYAKTPTYIGAQTAVFKLIKSTFASILPKAEHLICTHLLAMMATVGLVPFWILNEVGVSGQLKPFNWLKKTYKVEKKKDSSAKVLSNLVHGFKNHLDLAVLDRLVENVVCKWYCFVNGRDSCFCDLFLSL